MIKVVNKIWGSEEWLVNRKMYCAKYLYLKHGYQCSLQYHKEKDETFYCLEGLVKLEVDNKVYTLAKGQQFHIPKTVIHRFTPVTKTAKILEISTHHEDSDTYRLEKGGKIENA